MIDELKFQGWGERDRLRVPKAGSRHIAGPDMARVFKSEIRRTKSERNPKTNSSGALEIEEERGQKYVESCRGLLTLFTIQDDDQVYSQVILNELIAAKLGDESIKVNQTKSNQIKPELNCEFGAFEILIGPLYFRQDLTQRRRDAETQRRGLATDETQIEHRWSMCLEPCDAI